jgi:hypothetical protein
VSAPSAAMSTQNEYNVAEAAARLGWAGATLRDKCSARTVPHHRRHLVKGIFFTDDDIAAIQARQQRQPGLALRAGAQPLSDHKERTLEDAQIDAALSVLYRPTQGPSGG